MKTLHVLSVLILIVGCSSTGEKLYFESFDKGWSQKKEVVFDFYNAKPSETYHLFLYIRNNEKYPFANIHLVAQLKDPLGTTITDTLTYRLAAPDGRWLGKGMLSKESKLWYKENLVLPYIGTYEIRVRPAMRYNENIAPLELLPGVVAAGIGVEKAQ